jgi:hypothetical protein
LLRAQVVSDARSCAFGVRSHSARNSSGGGGGGTIQLIAPNITGTGILFVNGGGADLDGCVPTSCVESRAIDV